MKFMCSNNNIYYQNITYNKMEYYTRIDVFVAPPHYEYGIHRIFNEIKPIYIKTQNFDFHKKLCNIISNIIFKISDYLSENNDNSRNKSNKPYEDKLFGTLSDDIYIDFFSKHKKTPPLKTISDVEKYIINYFVYGFSEKYKYFYYVIPSYCEKIDNRLFISFNKINENEQILAKEYNGIEEDKIIYYMMKKMIKECLNPFDFYPTDEEIKEYFFNQQSLY